MNNIDEVLYKMDMSLILNDIKQTYGRLHYLVFVDYLEGINNKQLSKKYKLSAFKLQKILATCKQHTKLRWGS